MGRGIVGSETTRIVGVMGSGTDTWEERAVGLGRLLANLGVHLLTGGGQGVMASVSRGFAGVQGRRGLVIGVLPCAQGSSACTPPDGYPNEWVELAIRTHLPCSGARGTERGSRNHINVLTADVIVALPGGAGTSSEVRLALGYGRPVAAYVRSRLDIPELPPEVPFLATLDSVREFVCGVPPLGSPPT